MIKTIFILNIEDLPNELPMFERWYLRNHAQEAVGGNGPWLSRYLGYRVVPPIPEALTYGYYNWRVTEIWNRSLEDMPGRGKGATISYRFPRQLEHQGLGGAKFYDTKWNGRPDFKQNVELVVPARPTEDFLGPTFYADEKTILRWYIAIKYPDGVPVEEGEDWFLNVHSKEVMQQTGLTRYFSHRTLEIPGADSQFPWVRLIEQWYENFDGWKKSVIESPPDYTPPPWAKYPKYPFLEPYVDFCSTFLLEYPTNDFLRDIHPHIYA